MAIKIERIVGPSIHQWEAVIRGMRNPLNSWGKSDSGMKNPVCDSCEPNQNCQLCDELRKAMYIIGPNDKDLMKRLAKSGGDHRKYLRMLPVMMDVTAPLYWWKEYDTYKVGTVANSCSTMHKIADHEFTWNDFSSEHLDEACLDVMQTVMIALNYERRAYLQTNNKDHWWNMIQLLPTSYNQKRTLFLNYEVLWKMYCARKGHKLDEWKDFCETVARDVPYFKEIFELDGRV